MGRYIDLLIDRHLTYARRHAKEAARIEEMIRSGELARRAAEERCNENLHKAWVAYLSGKGPCPLNGKGETG